MVQYGIHRVNAKARHPNQEGCLSEAMNTDTDVQSDDQLRQIVDNVPTVITVLDADGKFIYANRVAREYTDTLQVLISC